MAQEGCQESSCNNEVASTACPRCGDHCICSFTTNEPCDEEGCDEPYACDLCKECDDHCEGHDEEDCLDVETEPTEMRFVDRSRIRFGRYAGKYYMDVAETPYGHKPGSASVSLHREHKWNKGSMVAITNRTSSIVNESWNLPLYGRGLTLDYMQYSEPSCSEIKTITNMSIGLMTYSEGDIMDREWGVTLRQEGCEDFCLGGLVPVTKAFWLKAKWFRKRFIRLYNRRFHGVSICTCITRRVYNGMIGSGSTISRNRDIDSGMVIVKELRKIGSRLPVDGAYVKFSIVALNQDNSVKATDRPDHTDRYIRCGVGIKPDGSLRSRAEWARMLMVSDFGGEKTLTTRGIPLKNCIEGGIHSAVCDVGPNGDRYWVNRLVRAYRAIHRSEVFSRDITTLAELARVPVGIAVALINKGKLLIKRRGSEGGCYIHNSHSSAVASVKMDPLPLSSLVGLSHMIHDEHTVESGDGRYWHVQKFGDMGHLTEWRHGARPTGLALWI